MKRQFTTAEVADIIGSSAKFIRDEIAGGHLKAHRVGRGHYAGSRLVVALDEVNRYCLSLGIAPPLVGDVPLQFAWGAFMVLFNGFPYPATCASETIVAINQPCLDLYGYTREQIIGKPAFGFIVSPTVEEVGLIPRHAQLNDVLVRCGDGQARRFIIQRVPVNIAGKRYVVAIHKAK